MIYVTHDQIEAMTLADRIAVMRGGVIQQLDAPQAIYNRPVNRFVAGFIGSPGMNFFEGNVDADASSTFKADDYGSRWRATNSSATTADGSGRRCSASGRSTSVAGAAAARPALLDRGRGRGRRADGLRHAGLDQARRRRTSPSASKPKSCSGSATRSPSASTRAGFAFRRSRRQHGSDPLSEQRPTTKKTEEIMDWSFQLYSVPQFRKPWDKVLQDARQARLQAGRRFRRRVCAIRTPCAPSSTKNGLTMPTGHFSIDMLENDFDRRATTLPKTLGIKLHRLPVHLAPDDRPTDAAGWRAFGERLGKDRRAGQGGRLSTSPGTTIDFEFEPLADGTTPHGAHPRCRARRSAGRWTWPGWCAAARTRRLDRPTTAIASSPFMSRTSRPAGENADEDGWADVGHGTVDWKGTLKAAADNTDGRAIYVMEHDKPSDAARFAKRSIEPSVNISEEYWRWRRNSASASSAAAISRPPISGWRRSSRASKCAPAPTSTWMPPRRGPKEFGVRAETVDELLEGRRHRHRRQPDDSGGAL